MSTPTMKNEDLQKQLKQQLKAIDDQLQELKISVSNPTDKSCFTRKPIADIVIPNKLFLLWDRKTALQRKLGASVSKHCNLAQSCIGKDLTLKVSESVEKRLKKESSRFLKFYRSKKIGTMQRKNMLECNTCMTFFKDEVDSLSQKYSGKDYSDLSNRHQRRRKAEIRNDIEKNISDPLLSIGLTVETVTLKEINTNNSFQISISNNVQQQPKGEVIKEGVHIPEICYLLLKYGVSFKCYHELAMECTELPRSYKVKEFKRALPIPKILPTPGSFQGAQFEFNELLMKLAKEEIEAHSNYYDTKKSLFVKISGDGARYNKSSTFCLISFTFIRRYDANDISSNDATEISSDEHSSTIDKNKSSSLSSADVHTIAVIKGQENYENIKEGFRDVIEKVNFLIKQPTITICDTEYDLTFALCADYKFLLTTMGMKQANSSYSCIWCEIKDEQRHDMDLKPLKRSLHSIKANATKNKLGCIKAPLFDMELSHVVADELHLLLRITDVLIQALLDTAVAHDHHMVRGRRRVKPQDGPMVQSLIRAIQSCNVNFYVWEDKKAGNTLLWPSLMGTEKKKLLKTLPCKFSAECQPANLVDKVMKLWNDFDGIYNTLSSYTPTSHHDLQERGKEWISLFLEIGKVPISDGYQPMRVTPYMHIMVCHIPEMIDFHGNIKQFSCQGVEKNNDDAKHAYYRNSNKWDAPYDILATEHRIHQLRGCKRTTRDYDKTNEEYFKKGGIQESRKKRQRISHQNPEVTEQPEQ